MKLMPPAEARAKKGQEELRVKDRIKDLQEEEDRLLKSAVRVELEFQQRLAKERKEWADELEAISKTKRTLEKEIEELKTERAQLLTPIRLIEEEAQRKLAEAEETGINAHLRETEAAERLKFLEDRLDTVSETQKEVLEREQRLAGREENVKLSEKMAAESRGRLDTAINDFLTEKEAKLKEITEKETANTLISRSLENKERKLEEREKEIEVAWKRIADQRATLERAMARLKK